MTGNSDQSMRKLKYRPLVKKFKKITSPKFFYEFYVFCQGRLQFVNKSDSAEFLFSFLNIKGMNKLSNYSDDEEDAEPGFLVFHMFINEPLVKLK